MGDESGLKQWLTWAEEKMKKFGDFAPGVKETKTDCKQASSEEKQNKTDDAKSITNSGDDKPGVAPAAAAPVDNNAMPTPKISHDWYQTETQVVVEVRIKKLSADMVKVGL